MNMCRLASTRRICARVIQDSATGGEMIDLIHSLPGAAQSLHLPHEISIWVRTRSRKTKNVNTLERR